MRRLPPLVTGLALLPLLSMMACQDSEAPNLQAADAAPQQAIGPRIWVLKDISTGRAYAINSAGSVVGQNSANQPFLYAKGGLTTLPLLPGTVVGRATGINDRGDIIGTADPAAGSTRGWFRAAGTTAPVEILPPAGGSIVTPLAVNSIGLVVGQYLSATGWSAFKWLAPSTFVDLHTSGALADLAADVSNGNKIVGWVNHTGHCDTRAWDFTGNDLSTLAGACTAAAEGVNNGGVVVGYSSTANSANPLAVQWSNVGAILNLNFGGVLSEARAVSDSGRVVGYRELANGSAPTPLTWYKGTLQILPVLSSGYGDAVAVNNCGLVAGYSVPAGSSSAHAVIWQRTELGRVVTCTP
jgi:probable HAF family extracellular repeat protein